MFDEKMLNDAVKRMLEIEKAEKIERVTLSKETFDMLTELDFYKNNDPGMMTTLVGIEIKIDERLRLAKGLARIDYKYREPQYIFFKGDK